ncbi:hypothetical protein ACT7C9_32030 [Bacillus cereus]
MYLYSIDVGELQDGNLGIDIGFCIVQNNRFAKISHIEVKEESPLTENKIKQVQRKEKKGNKTYKQLYSLRLMQLMRYTQMKIGTEIFNLLY